MALILSSPVIQNEGEFPADYTCNGKDVSPPIKISDVPQGTKSLVLIFDDPDAAKEPAGSGQTFDHWLVYNIEPIDQEIAENSTPKGQPGKNSRGSSGYIGPCPPTFRHKYIFRLLALDTTLELGELPSKAEIEQAAESHIIEEASLTAYYQQAK